MGKRIRETIQNLVTNFVRSYKSSNQTSTGWNEPLVAFADALDPGFRELRTIIGPSHSLPTELLEDARTVIAYFVPFKRETVLSNVSGEHCSREWALAYIETNGLLSELTRHLSVELKDQGFQSTGPPPTHNFDEATLMSRWSHKHVAEIAGLGRFGLHHMLITEQGCCGRLGSLVTDAVVEPTTMPDREFCLYHHDGSCRKCVDNCSFGALGTEAFDRYRCYEVCCANGERYSQLGLADACGKCACVVPCSFTDPVG